jgi:predicted phage terminase large subunit-like protein
MEHEKNRLDWQGSQIPFIGFDELTHFTEKQFDYLLSRNRSMCGVRPYIRATCNPEPESWVKDLIRWWLDDEGRYADKEKSGIIRWFIRAGNDKIWGDSEQELKDQYGEDCAPLSITFIHSSIEDNKILLRKDPTYLAKLKQMPSVERQQLLYGDWLSKRMAGNIFRAEWFVPYDIEPKCKATVRFWDKAATVATDKNPDPDWTFGVKLGYLAHKFYVLDVIRLRGTPSAVEQAMLNAAQQDGTKTAIRWEEEGGSSGKESTYHLAKLLVGYNTGGIRPIRNKVERSKPVSAAAEHGLIHIVEGEWNKAFLTELENFPQEGVHDDQVDALSGAFNYLTKGNTQIKASRYISTR